MKAIKYFKDQTGIYWRIESERFDTVWECKVFRSLQLHEKDDPSAQEVFKVTIPRNYPRTMPLVKKS
jgi:hypothetical protein